MRNKKRLITYTFASMLIASVVAFSGCGEKNDSGTNTPGLESLSPTLAPTDTLSPTAEPTQTPTLTPVPTDTPIPTPTSTMKPTVVPKPTNTTKPTSTPKPTKTPVPTSTPVPTVELGREVNTDLSTYDFIVNKEFPLDSDYVPDNLVAPKVRSYSSDTDPKRLMEATAAKALEEMFFDAENDYGLQLYTVSGYRSYARQYQLYTNYLSSSQNVKRTNSYSAGPGRSEHQTGLAMDVDRLTTSDKLLLEEFAETPEGMWLTEHCWEYGFIIRYPKGKEDITGYAYEPWHVRYVGIPLAYYLTTNNLTLEEYYGVAHPEYNKSLESTVLIDVTDEKFIEVYESKVNSVVVRDATGVPIVDNNNLPLYKKQVIVNGKVFTAKNPFTNKAVKVLYEPVIDGNGNIARDKKGNVIWASPVTDADGDYIINSEGQTVCRIPVIDYEGNFILSSSGSVIFYKELTDKDGNLFIFENGNVAFELPILDENDEIALDDDGNVIFNKVSLSSGSFVTTEDGYALLEDANQQKIVIEYFKELNLPWLNKLIDTN